MKHSQKFLCAILSLAFLSSRAQEVKVSSGLNVSAEGPVHVVFNGMGLNNSGQFKIENGTMTFTGTTVEGRAFISGSRPVFLHNLTIDRSSGDLQLENRIYVYGKLNLVQGNLDLNNNSVDLGSTGFLEGESRMARVIGNNGGYIKVITDLNSPNDVNPGNLGLQLSSKDNLGTTTIIRGHLQQLNQDGELSIQRYYEIDPAFPASNKITAHANFLDVESANHDPQDLVLWSSPDAGRNWTAVNVNSKEYELPKEQGQLPLRVTYFSREMNDQIRNGFIQLYPNPVMERFTLSFSSPKQEDLFINLYNSSGQLLETRRIKTVDGLNKIDWPVGKYPGGNYQLRFAGEKMRTMTFTKQ